MKIQQVRAIAKGMGVNSARMGKGEIIRAIQRAEGNFDCFGSATCGHCDQSGCAWRGDCLSTSAALGAIPPRRNKRFVRRKTG